MKQGPTWNTAHVYGECVANHDKKLLFVKIPKCASTWCDQYLARLGQIDLANTWTRANFQDPALRHYRALVVLRDPLDRWISQSPAKEKISADITQDQLATILLDLPSYLNDEHLAPQSDFVSGLDHGQLVCFQFGVDLGRDFSKFIASCGLAEVSIGHHLNQGQNTDSKQTWRTLLQRSDVKAQIQLLYQKDYDLMAAVKFWRATARS